MPTVIGVWSLTVGALDVEPPVVGSPLVAIVGVAPSVGSTSTDDGVVPGAEVVVTTDGPVALVGVPAPWITCTCEPDVATPRGSSVEPQAASERAATATKTGPINRRDIG
jgi:hypothetical protein